MTKSRALVFLFFAYLQGYQPQKVGISHNIRFTWYLHLGDLPQYLCLVVSEKLKYAFNITAVPPFTSTNFYYFILV